MIKLPEGWKNWPVKEQEKLLALLEQVVAEKDSGRVLWLCTAVPGGAGAPHAGREGRHARQPQRPRWTRTGTRGFSWRGVASVRRGQALSGLGVRPRTTSAEPLSDPPQRTRGDIIVEGESESLACAPATFRPVYEPSKRRLTYPNGAIQTLYSADEPDRLRGPQHFYFWADELAAWRYLQYAGYAPNGFAIGRAPARMCYLTTPSIGP